MKPRYLLDTNTASYVIRGVPPQVRSRLVQVPMHALAVSAITEAELRFGAERHPRPQGLRAVVDAFLARLEVLAWDSAAARVYGRVRADLTARGGALGAMDMLIAAHALATGAVLVTSDRAFGRIDGLSVEDWTRD